VSGVGWLDRVAKVVSVLVRTSDIPKEWAPLTRGVMSSVLVLRRSMRYLRRFERDDKRAARVLPRIHARQEISHRPNGVDRVIDSERRIAVPVDASDYFTVNEVSGRKFMGTVRPTRFIESGVGLTYVGRYAAKVGCRPLPTYVPDYEAGALLLECGAPSALVNETMLKQRKPGGWQNNWPNFAEFGRHKQIPQDAAKYTKEALYYIDELPLDGSLRWDIRREIRNVRINEKAYAGFFGSRQFGGKKKRAFMRGYAHVIEVYDRIVKSDVQLYATSMFEIGGRDKIVNDKSKPSRIVLMDDFVPTIIGAAVVAQVTWKFVEAKKNPIYMGQSWYKCGFFRFLDDIDHECTVENDWKFYDSTVPAYLIRQAFALITAAFQPKGREQELEISRIMSYLYANFVHSLVIVPGGYVYRKSRGIPSGSAFTALVGSLVNWLALRAGLCTVMPLGRGPGQSGSIVLTVSGDDSTLSGRKKDSFQMQLALVNACKLFGLIQKPEQLKVTYRDERVELDEAPTFLGYTFRKGYPERNDEKIVEAIILHEYHSRREIDKWSRYERARTTVQLSPMTIGERPWLRAYAERTLQEAGWLKELAIDTVERDIANAIDYYTCPVACEELFYSEQDYINWDRMARKSQPLVLPFSITEGDYNNWISVDPYKPSPSFDAVLSRRVNRSKKQGISTLKGVDTPANTLHVS